MSSFNISLKKPSRMPKLALLRSKRLMAQSKVISFLLLFIITDVSHGRRSCSFSGVTGASKFALTSELEMRSLLRLSKQALTLQSEVAA